MTATDDSALAMPRDKLPAHRQSRLAHARSLIAAYLRERRNPRTAAYRSAVADLAAFAREHGGWIQVDGIRVRWDAADEAVYVSKVTSNRGGCPPPNKV